MKPRKICEQCHEAFDPYPSQYHRQKTCSKPHCQSQRRRQTNRKYRAKNRYDADYRREVKKAWHREYGRAYMRQYRRNHADYVKRNRRQQHRRDREKPNLVKKDVWKALYSGKLMRIRILETSCKERLMRLLPDEKSGKRGFL